MKPGEIVLLRFPQADLQSGKLRPALVLAIAPGRHTDVLLALVTSRPYQETAGLDVPVDPVDVDFVTSGLKVRSIIRLTRLASVEQTAINARLGRISSERLLEVKKRLVDWIKA